MKATIDNENKAKFFALYWGQEILRTPISDGNSITQWICDGNMVFIEEDHLELKPLSSISDEDAIDLMYHIDEKEWVDGLDNKAAWGKGMVEKFIHHKTHSHTSALLIDFLRSRGYLLPWMSLSVEEIIEAGWAKYKEQ